MRRGSVIGPLILIGLGALFLLRNVWPEVHVGEILSNYWPFILIAWGGLRLVEILFWAMSSKPLPRNGVSGGEWVLVIFICLIGSAAWTAHRQNWWFPTSRLNGLVIDMGESYDYALGAAEKPCGKNCRVVIEGFRGNARIVGGEGTTVRVSGRKTIRSMQQNTADKANNETPLELIVQGDQVLVRTNQDRVNDRLRISDDLEITVPANASIEGHGRLGDFDVKDVQGNVEINSDNAGVRIDNVGGNVRVDLQKSDIIRATGVKGSVDLKGRGHDLDLENITGTVNISGTYVGQVQLRNLSQPVRYEDPSVTLNFEKLPGQIHMGLGEFTGENIVGPIRLSARSRDVQMSEFTQSLDLSLDRGDIELRPGKSVPKMDVHTRSGDLDLALAPGTKFDLKASTDKGEIHNDYGTPLTVEEDHHGATVSGSVGGGPQVRLQTGRGAVTVRKGNADDVKVPAAPPEAPGAPEKPAKPGAPLKVERQ
jgi:DUF4097 and DUF4098 domain-containing protein YvlB